MKTLLKLALDVHNTFRIIEEKDKDHPNNVNPQVYPFMIPLIEKLSRKHPNWEFHATYGYPASRHQDGTTFYARFHVQEGEDRLGWIDYESRARVGHTYTFTCDRLDKKRSRGSYSFTNNLDKAYKTIIENMYGLTPVERLSAAKNATASVLNSVYANATNAMHTPNRVLTNHFKAFALARWEEFRATLDASNKNIVGAAGTYPELAAKLVEAETIHRDAKQGWVVAIHGSQYIVEDVKAGEKTIYTTDTLLPYVKQMVGILKLMEDSLVVPAIGVRVGNHYAIVAELPEVVDE